MAQPNVTGLSALGEALANGSRDYANLEIAQRQRNEQRAYNEAQAEKARREHLDDVKALEIFRGEQAGIQVLINEHLLNPQDASNTAAVKAAFEEAQRRGIDKLYNELLTTPGPDGKPLLTHADLADSAKIAAAKDALGAIKAQQLRFSLDQPQLQQADLSRLRAEELNIQQQIKTLSDDLERTGDYVPSEAEIKNAANILALQTVKPGEVPSSAAIEAQRPAAIQQLHAAGVERQMLEKQRKTVQLQALYQQLAATKSQAQSYISRGLGPTAPAVMPPAAIAPTVAKPAASPISFAQMLSDEMAKRNPAPAVAPAAGAALANPTGDPMIAEENTRRVADNWQANLADPYNDALDRRDSLIEQIKLLSSGAEPAFMPTPGNLYPAAPMNKSVRAEKLSNLYVQLEDTKRDIENKRRAMLGVKGQPARAPAVAPRGLLSVPSTAAPVFNQSVPAFTSPSILQLPNWFSAAPAGG